IFSRKRHSYCSNHGPTTSNASPYPFLFHHLPVRHLTVFICVFITGSLAAGHYWVFDIILLSEFDQMFLVDHSKAIVQISAVRWL
ncbi:hypothetical protein K443DRAFT_81729, partial [Laccaria amethystina LaAM-08-1]